MIKNQRPPGGFGLSSVSTGAGGELTEFSPVMKKISGYSNGTWIEVPTTSYNYFALTKREKGTQRIHTSPNLLLSNSHTGSQVLLSPQKPWFSRKLNHPESSQRFRCRGSMTDACGLFVTRHYARIFVSLTLRSRARENWFAQ